MENSDKGLVCIPAILSISPGLVCVPAPSSPNTCWWRGHFLLSLPIVLSSLVYNTISLQTLRINEFLISVRKHIKNEQRKLSMDPISCICIYVQFLVDLNWLKALVICQVACRLNGPRSSFMGHHLPLNCLNCLPELPETQLHLKGWIQNMSLSRTWHLRICTPVLGESTVELWGKFPLFFSSFFPPKFTSAR